VNKEEERETREREGELEGGREIEGGTCDRRRQLGRERENHFSRKSEPTAITKYAMESAMAPLLKYKYPMEKREREREMSQ
jgi:hypothetical protein